MIPGTASLPDRARPAPDDAELARRIARGDRGAFEPLMRRHNRLLYRLARSILRDDAEAEDAVQEAYVSAFRHFDTFRGDSALSTWLARIVVNEAYGRVRKRKRDARVIAFDSHQRDSHDTQPASEKDMADERTEGPESAAIRAELRGLIEGRIDSLPEQFRTVFVLRDVQELSVEETARCLDIPEATVRSRAFRARALLRESLARDLDVATLDAFGFDGERCDRIVASVLARLETGARSSGL
jgi:RNA polymerase sigma-70 factor (ECF subfamily)